MLQFQGAPNAFFISGSHLEAASAACAPVALPRTEIDRELPNPRQMHFPTPPAATPEPEIPAANASVPGSP